MKITAIQQQVKRPERYSIFVDGKYSFSFGESMLLDQGLRIGQELGEQEVHELKKRSSDDKIYNAALRYIAMRQRSEWEIASYLERKGAEPALQTQILNKLSNYGYVDDEKFAAAWVENRRLLRPISKRKLQQELKLKRVNNEVIEKVLQGDETDELAVLKALIIKKRPRYPDRLKLMQYLAGQGFGYDDIKTSLDELGKEQPD
ncbi:MAG: RecX family transcriptional regulator [Candidatus Saccharimonadales bacterium]